MSEFEVKVTTTGSAGSAIGSTDSSFVKGLLGGIYLKYKAGIPATTVVTISEIGGAGRTLLTVTGNTEGIEAVQVQAVGLTGAVLPGVYVFHQLTARQLRFAVTLSNADTDAVTATIYIIE